MSVEPSTLERSALERKDREELTTIAQTLGAKPSSRARKAEIVQLILELTGVEPGQKEASVDDNGDTGGSAPAKAAATPEAPESADTEADADTDTDAGDDTPAPTGEDEPPAEWELEFGGTTDVVDEPGGGENGRSGGTNGDAAAGGGDKAGGARGSGSDKPGGQRQGGDQRQG